MVFGTISRHAGKSAGNLLRNMSASGDLARGLATQLPELEIINPGGSKRVVVTKDLPGDRWHKALVKADCRVEVCSKSKDILSVETIKTLIGSKCDGVIGQLTEDWGDELFGALKAAGGTAYSNYAVGYNNVDVPAATKHGIPVGNTPGVLTETTAELAAALTLAAARRVVESDYFMRGGKYEGWLPNLFVGSLLQHKTVGIIGAGRIGSAYAKMMVEGHKMDLVYYDPYPNKNLEKYMKAYGDLQESFGERRITCTRLATPEDVLKEADVVSLHCNLDENTTHLINKERLALMKKDAVLVNAARGPVIDEVALVSHLQANPQFRAGLDVFEDEPLMKPGLAECMNAVIVPHIASASLWTRGGMATLAGCNVAARLSGYPVWGDTDISAFVDGPFDDIPKASPSIVNAKDLGLPKM
ncbi:hypothetical protein BSKO_11533 [Bryopsis sp. KO-2023]|nr:hypothetical protein BSKO_11533 [Bryopsis sp. KO-2023]